MMRARVFHVACLAFLLSCGGEPTATPVLPPIPPIVPPPLDVPLSGAALPGMEAFDQAVAALMPKYKLPGGAIAIVREGKLIYARGFGYADVENKIPVQPDALFRIASVSKPITSAAVMKLVEEGKLSLGDKVAPFIADLAPPPGATVDPRWDQITIRHLLNHTGGWDRDKPNGGFDPMSRETIAAQALNVTPPASTEILIRYMKGMPLDFTPGEKWVYSNFGYAILGLIVTRVSGMPYAEYVRSRVLLPVGAKRTQQGRSRLADALAGEVRYYVPGLGLNGMPVPSVFPGEGVVPFLYGGFYMEGNFASGAWVSSTIDLLRFVNGVDGRAVPADIMSPATVAEMTSKNNGATVCGDGSCHYAGGWWVRPIQGDATWWHGGDYPGTKAFLVRSSTNVSWAALFNAGASNAFINELESALWSALNKMTTFPANDLFPSFP